MDYFRSITFRCVLALLAWVALTTVPLAAAEEPIRWRTAAEMRQHRGERISLTWSGMPLRRGLASLARSQRIAVLLDRRIDPDRTLELTFDGETVEEVFERIARDQNLGLSWFGPLAYFAPPAAARRLRTVTTLRENEAKQLPSKNIGRALLRQRPCKSDDLRAPRELVQTLAAAAA